MQAQTIDGYSNTYLTIGTIARTQPAQLTHDISKECLALVSASWCPRECLRCHTNRDPYHVADHQWLTTLVQPNSKMTLLVAPTASGLMMPAQTTRMTQIVM